MPAKCTKCGYKNSDDALNCNLCGEIIRRESGPVPPPGKKGDLDAPPRETLAKTEMDPLKFRVTPTSLTDEIETIIAPNLVPQDDPSQLNWFMVCFPLEPVPVSRERKTVIGRSGECDLILPVGVVSRQHAEIAWSENAFVLRDLNSFNGTFVNDNKIDSHALKDNDVIRIGPYSIQVRAISGGMEDVAAIFKPKDKTEVFIVSDLVDKESSFSGRIGEVKSEEIFQLIDFNKKSGTLEIESGGKKGEFRFHDGQIVFADFNHTTGETAVIRVLNLNSGSFQFMAGEPGPERNIFESTSKILLNAMRRRDEFSR